MINETRTKKHTVYICEICGKESLSAGVIHACEDIHKDQIIQSRCDHKFNYESDINHDDRASEDILFKKTCKKCGFFEAKYIDIDGIDQEALAKIFNESKE